MTSKSLMLAGSIFGAFFILVAFLLEQQGTGMSNLTVVIFAAGALFGKGYGIYECKSKGRR